MADRDEILAFANDYLELPSYPDYGPMGLQVIGTAEITKIACGVSASSELFERAAGAGAEIIIVHHGLFWDRDPRVIGVAMRSRLEALFRTNMNLAAYHLALDAHREVGNNALLCRLLGFEPNERFADVGFGGTLGSPVGIDEITASIERELGRPPLVFAEGPTAIRRVAICSGGAARLLTEAIEAGYDCYITGEPSEPSMATAREAGIHFIAAGHYATETLGVQALSALLAEHFELDWDFIDLPNPV